MYNQVPKLTETQALYAHFTAVQDSDIWQLAVKDLGLRIIVETLELIKTTTFKD